VFLSFGALLFALSAPSPAQAAAPSREPEPARAPQNPHESMLAAVAEAEAALRAGEPQIAESRYRDALLEGWLLLGRIEEEAGDLTAARLAYEAAATSTVESRRARVALALVLIRLGATDEAELVLRTLISEDPSDHEARRFLAKAFAEAGKLDEAVQELEQLRYLTPGDPENAYLLATAYLRQDRLDEADALLAEIAAALPTAQTHVLIGRTYRDADRYDRARRSLEAALAIDPEVRRAHYYLGTVALLDQGTSALADAARELELELRVAPGDEIASLYLGMALVEDRRFAEAIAPLEVASRRADLRADALRFLGRALLEAGRPDDAIAALRQGLEAAGAALAPEQEPTRSVPTRSVPTGPEPTESEPNGSVPTRSVPTGSEPSEFRARLLSSLHYQLAQALRARGEREAADLHFAEAKRYQSRSAESARESLDRYLASETAGDGLGAGANRPTADAAETDPADRAQLLAFASDVETSLARTHLNLGILRVRENDHRRATGHFERAAEIDPDLPGLQYSLGVALFNSGRFERAAVALTSALEEGAGAGGRALEMLALAWLNAGEHARAAELLATIPERDATPGLQYARGLALIRSGQAAAASEVFQRLLRDNAEWPELEVVLGQAYAQQGDFEAAVASLRRALALDPEVAEAHSTLAEIHLRRGELAEAETELREELRFHPQDSRSRYALATVLDLAQKPDEAASLLRALLADQPDLAKGRTLLGKILLARGETEEAREQLEAAAGLSPADPETRYLLGQAYQKLGRATEAQREFEAFRQLKREERTGEGS
jgi:tetratricopeptide (TPR) repeat protein